MDQQQHGEGGKQQHQKPPRHHAGFGAHDVGGFCTAPAAENGQAHGQGSEDQGEGQAHALQVGEQKTFGKPEVVGMANQQPSVNQGRDGLAGVVSAPASRYCSYASIFPHNVGAKACPWWHRRRISERNGALER